MTTDILQWFPFRGHNVNYGLFKIPISKRTKTYHLSKNRYGVTQTYYSDANEIQISDNITLLDMFHGYCLPFALYFTDQNPDFIPTILERPYSEWNFTNHVFALKHLNDGTCLFADARGITDDPIEFFSDYSFSKNNMQITTIKTDNPNKNDEICKITYQKMFENCPYLQN